ncbi:MAG: hypothetical protein AAGK09_11950 [Planctomycetota bacterium]
MIKLDAKTEQLLLGYLEGDLDEAERWRAEAELTRRPELARWVRAMQDDRAALRGATPESVPESVRETLDALREREVLLGDGPGAAGSGEGVAGRIGPANVAAPARGARSLRMRRWTVRLAAAAAVLLCAAVMVQSIIGTNLLRSITPGAQSGDELAMSSQSAPGADRSPLAGESPRGGRESGRVSDMLPSLDARRRSDAPFGVAAAPGRADAFDDSALGLADAADAAEIEMDDTADGRFAAIEPASPPVTTDPAESLGDTPASSRLAVAQPVSPAPTPESLGIDAASAPMASARIDAEEEPAFYTRSAAAINEVTQGRSAGLPLGETVEPALRVEVDTANQAATYTDLQRWAIANAVVVEPPADELASADGLGRFAYENQLKRETDEVRAIRQYAAPVEQPEGVQVVQLAVPADRVDALLTHLNNQGRQRVRLLSDGGEVAAQRGMSIDRHPQVAWVPLDAAPRDLGAAGQANRYHALNEEVLAQAEAYGLATAPEAEASTADESPTLAGVDLAAMLRNQAPTVSTMPLSDWLPEPPVNIELFLREQPDLVTQPAPASTAMPAAPATPAPLDAETDR